MALAWRRFKVYVRGAIIVIVVAAVVLILFENRNHEASVWFFGLTDVARPVNVIWIVLVSALGALVVRLAVRIGWRFVQDVAELKKIEDLDRALEEQKKRAAELDERERRIGEKYIAPGTPGDVE